MTMWVLYLLLSTGESGQLEVPEDVCRQAVIEHQSGGEIGITKDDGIEVIAIGVACHGPREADPCGERETS